MALYEIKSEKLTLTVNPTDLKYYVELNNGDAWSFTQTPYVLFTDGRKAEFGAPEEEKAYHTGTSDGVKAIYGGFEGSDVKFYTHVYVEHTTGDVYFTIRAEGDKKCEIKYLVFPAGVDFGAVPGEGYTIIPRMQGTMFPAGEEIKYAGGEVFERDAYMPIFGQVRGSSGYTAIYDTPYDARYAPVGDRIEPRWITSLGTISYMRKFIYRFIENCDYNRIAKAYRSYIKERGRFVSLEEKAARNPNVARLIGCPVIHSGIATHISPDSNYYNKDNPAVNDNYVSFDTRATQIRALRERGLEKGYTHFDGWGNHGYDNLHPSPFPPHEAAGGTEGMKHLAQACRDVGYIFGIHDQYRDYYYDSPDFSLDNAVMYDDGTHPFCSVWYGGKHSFLCSEVAIDYVRRNYAEFEKLGIDVEAAYLDVFSVVRLDECFNPDHMATREQCAANRRRCLDILTDRGIIPSSEEILDCILPSQILCHHAPFFTSDLGGSNADPVGIPIPLLSLVYHDCVVIPWGGSKGQRGGWGIPGNDSAYLYAILYGCPVYCSITADEKEIKDVEEACGLAAKLAYTEMLSHEFIDGNIRRQRTTFADGTVIEADLDTLEYTVNKK